MAVELDVRLTRPCDPETIRSQVSELLRKHPHPGLPPDVRLQAWENPSDKGPAQHPCMSFHIGEVAGVSVVPYTVPGRSGTWASVSYGMLRTPESKRLCLAVAVVLARHDNVAIQDENNLFGSGGWIDPERAFLDPAGTNQHHTED